MAPMPRPPFDPKRSAAARRAAGAEGEESAPARRERRWGSLAEARELSVSELSTIIRETLEDRVPGPLRVIGQVSNLRASGHWYFTLKDDEAVIGCVAWNSAARSFGFVPADGDEVVATGRVGHYAPQGRTQFYVTGLRAIGAGALQLRFERLCAELRGLGWFAEERKRPLPFLPRRIAVVTSADGAAIHDVLATARKRLPAVGIVLVDVRVQGEAAAPEIADALRWIGRNGPALGIDAIIVTRGGGSIEDLQAFNERIVAEAIHAAPLPVVAAIGHESDVTIAELVADRRASTPTQAAMLLVPAREELAGQVAHLADRLAHRSRRVVERARERAERTGRAAVLRDPRAILRAAGERLAARARRLAAASHRRVAGERLRLEALARRRAEAGPRRRAEASLRRLGLLEHRLRAASRERCRDAASRLAAADRSLRALDPRAVLRRGFTWTTDAEGRLLRRTGDAAPGMRIATEFQDGRVHSVVEPAATGSKRRRARGSAPEQPGLF